MTAFRNVPAVLAIVVALPLTGQAQVGERVRQQMGPIHFASPDSAAAHALAGCYEVAIDPVHARDTPSWLRTIPSTIELVDQRKDAPLPAGFWFVAHVPPDTIPSWQMPALGWTPVSQDSLQILASSTGYTSTVLFLRILSDTTFRGTARYFSDVRATDHSGRWLWEGEPNVSVFGGVGPCVP